MLLRTLEPELMDTVQDAREYDAMDHAAVNAVFVTDLLNALADWSLEQPDQSALHVLDLGAGTAQIPIELARRAPHLHITAVDAAQNMLDLARRNIAAAGLDERIELVLADAKNLRAPLRVAAKHDDSIPAIICNSPFSREAEALRSRALFSTARFPACISNSIVHHIAQPCTVVAEAIRVTAPGGLLFHRDLARPHDERHLERIVNTYAADATPYQRKLFADSLRAALTLEEVRALVADFGFPPDTVQLTSDRHWTWSAHHFGAN